MDKQTFKKQINTLNKEAEKLSALIEEMGLIDVTQTPDRYEAISVNAALKSEYITCQLRHLIYETTFVRKPDYLISAGETHGITVNCDNHVIEITLPCLLPKRRQHRSVEFLIDPLFFTLNQYAHLHKLPKFQHCVIDKIQ